jgi:DNA-binding Xre family transcriptional regulator/tetratricopeptide (TPR) repeat protein
VSSLKTALLDRQKLISLINEKDIKHAWLAHSIQVTEKTLTRWINCDVQRVRHSNLKKLAMALECDEHMLVASTETEDYPSEKNQAVLINELCNDSLLYQLIIGNKVKLTTSLIKSTFNTMLPSAIMGNFYIKLGYAALVHGKYKNATKYFQKAAAKAQEHVLSELQFSVNLAFAIFYFIKCNCPQCLQHLEECEKLNAFAGPELAHYYNTYALYYLYTAEFTLSYRYVEYCIHACGEDSHSIEKQVFLCSALQVQGTLSLLQKDYFKGQKLFEEALRVAMQSGYSRSICLAQAFLSAGLAVNGQQGEATKLVKLYMAGADRDDVSTPTLLCASMYVYYKNNDVKKMQETLLELEAICKGFSAPLTFARVLMLKAQGTCFKQRQILQNELNVSLKAMRIEQWHALIHL